MSVSAWLVVLAAGAAAVDPLAEVLYGRHRPQNRRDVNYMQVRLGDDSARDYGDDYPFFVRGRDDNRMPAIDPPKQSLWAKMFQSKDDYEEYETTRICITVRPTPKVTPSTTPQVICYTPIIGRKGSRTTTKFTRRLETSSSTKRPSTTTAAHPRTTCGRPSHSGTRTTEHTHERNLVPTKYVEALELGTRIQLHVPFNDSAKSSTKLHGFEGRNLTSTRTTLLDHIWHITPLHSHPSITHPSITHPSTTHPTITHPTITHPTITHPSTTHPSTTHPRTMHPSTTHPSTTHPSTTHPSTTRKHNETSSHPTVKAATPLKLDHSSTHRHTPTSTQRTHYVTKTLKTIFPFLKTTKHRVVGGCYVPTTRRTTTRRTTTTRRPTRKPVGCAIETTTTTQAPVDEFLAAWAFYRHHNSQKYPIRKEFHDGTMKPYHKRSHAVEKANEDVVVLLPPWLQRPAPIAPGMAFFVPPDAHSKRRRDTRPLHSWPPGVVRQHQDRQNSIDSGRTSRNTVLQ